MAVGMIAPLAAPLSASAAVVAAPPTQLPPAVHLKPMGALGTTTIPLIVSWTKATANGVSVNHYELEVSRDNGAWTPVVLARPRQRTVTVGEAAWRVLSFRVRAVDDASEPSDWAQSAPVWLETAQEDDAAVSLSGGWPLVSRATAFSGRRAVSTQSGNSATFTFSGREVGWVARKGRDAGTVDVMIDGRDPAPLNLYRSSAASRRIVFMATPPTTGAHTLTITTTSAGKVDVDAFVVLADVPLPETLVGAGDIASCNSTDDSDTAALAAGVAGIVFTAGDNVYPNGTADNFANCYDPSWGVLKSRTKPVPGNHEYEGVPGASGYFGYFGDAAGDPQEGWYKYDAGTWRVYALNSECDSTTCPQQLAWLKSDLGQEPHECSLALWHRPRFSTGPHGDATDMAAVWSLLAANGVDVVINGHDHVYERFTPLDADGNPSSTGIRDFVVGTGGESHYSFVTDSTSIDVRDNTSFGVLRLDLAQGGYSWQFLPTASGTFTDSGTSTCH